MYSLDPQRDRAERLAAAREIIGEAGAIALSYFERYRSLDVEEKTSGQDIVSIADWTVETFMRGAIRRRFGGDGIIGEEHGATAGVSGYQWLIDPIDGTSCFLHGLRSWSVVVAILEGGRPVIGLILEPCTGRLYWATQGRGACCNDMPLKVDAASSFANGLFAIGSGGPEISGHVGSIVAGVLARGGGYMRNGSAALSLAHVAAGHYLGFHEPVLNAWDCVAGLLIVSEAGGIADDFVADGELCTPRPCFAASPAVAEAFREIIEASPAFADIRG